MHTVLLRASFECRHLWLVSIGVRASCVTVYQRVSLWRVQQPSGVHSSFACTELVRHRAASVSTRAARVRTSARDTRRGGGWLVVGGWWLLRHMKEETRAVGQVVGLLMGLS